jgi:multimeric flavodoxin WrbA
MQKNNTNKFLLISGSPRKGNTDFILETIFKSIKKDKKLIYLKNKNIKHCTGCLTCDKTKSCVINDDMQEIYTKILDANFFIIGTPNYFDNVTGLLKDFIDRTNPFYKTKALKGKKIINIVVGGGKITNSKRAVRALEYFAENYNLDLVGSYCFKALEENEIKKDKNSLKLIDKIINKINL